MNKKGKENNNSESRREKVGNKTTSSFPCRRQDSICECHSARLNSEDRVSLTHRPHRLQCTRSESASWMSGSARKAFRRFFHGDISDVDVLEQKKPPSHVSTLSHILSLSHCYKTTHSSSACSTRLEWHQRSRMSSPMPDISSYALPSDFPNTRCMCTI